MYTFEINYRIANDTFTRVLTASKKEATAKFKRQIDIMTFENDHNKTEQGIDELISTTMGCLNIDLKRIPMKYKQ